MINIKDQILAISSPEYDKDFWISLKSKDTPVYSIDYGRTVSGSYFIPNYTQGKFSEELKKKSLFRKFCTEQFCSRVGGSIWADNIEDPVEFIKEGQSIPEKNIMDGLSRIEVKSHKIACLNRFTTEFFLDASFDVEKHVVKHLAQIFAKTEDKAFILGNGETEPTGLLHPTSGATLGVTSTSSSTITYDEVLSLYFSLKSDYRANGVWIMNDETALAVKKLKDDAGNYLWNSNNNTIMNRPVIYCPYMPGIAEGSKCILFGDLSYYWIIDRSLPSIKPLYELYAHLGLTAYIAFKFLDAKLIRPESVKYLQIKSSN